MRTNKLTIGITFGICAYLAHGQGNFQNLDFESATLSPVPPGPPPTWVSVSSAIPGWTAYLGAVQQAEVVQNDYSLGQASIDIFGPNYPTAGNLPGAIPGIIDGNYSVLLQQGGNPLGNGTLVNASIAQTGFVPLGSQSLQFKAWTTPFTEFSVSFDGNNLSPVALGSGANYTLYGVNISSYDGQTGPLEFTADFSGTGASWLGLDDIAFSTQAVPEPSPVILTGIGSLVLVLRRRWFRQTSS
jgi:hypothetical protein